MTAKLTGCPPALPEEPLPGLDPEPQDRAVTNLERRARQSLAALHEANKLGPQHAGLMELFLTLARSVDGAANARAPRASAVAMAAKEMREVWAALCPDDDDAPAAEEFTQWQTALAAVPDAGESA